MANEVDVWSTAAPADGEFVVAAMRCAALSGPADVHRDGYCVCRGWSAAPATLHHVARGKPTQTLSTQYKRRVLTHICIANKCARCANSG